MTCLLEVLQGPAAHRFRPVHLWIPGPFGCPRPGEGAGLKLWLWFQPTLHQHFVAGSRFGTKPQKTFLMQAELSLELPATSKSKMPKSDVDPKSFLQHSPAWKHAGITCVRRQKPPPQLVLLSHVLTACPQGGRRGTEPVLAPTPVLQGGFSCMDIPSWSRCTGKPCPHFPTSRSSCCSGQFC